MGESPHWLMERNRIRNAVIIGAGNVATHLVNALSHTIKIKQIYSRDIKHAMFAAKGIVNCTAINNLDKIDPTADIYIISVKDDAISNIVETACRRCPDKLWVHTSGSIPISVFDGYANRYGVLYPLQTFSRDVYVNISEVPFFIEGNDLNTEQEISTFAKLLSPLIYIADSDCRRRIHAAAVFACNLTNHLWSISNDILTEGGLSFDILAPLLQATLTKAINVSPYNAQTGPARRGDIGTMQKHLQILNHENQEIYKMLSKSIMTKYDIPLNDEQNKL